MDLDPLGYNMNLDNFYFVGDSCMDTYMNRHLNNPYTPFDQSTCLEDDFIKFVSNYNNIDVTDYVKIPYLDTRIFKYKSTYSWNGANKRLGVNINNTFAYSYGFKNSSDRVEFLYRHYHDTQENVDKIQRRIDRFLTYYKDKKPFFLMVPYNGEIPDMNYYIDNFLKLDYKYKLFVDHKRRGYSDSDCVHNLSPCDHPITVNAIMKKLEKLI